MIGVSLTNISSVLLQDNLAVRRLDSVPRDDVLEVWTSSAGTPKAPRSQIFPAPCLEDHIVRRNAFDQTYAESLFRPAIHKAARHGLAVGLAELACHMLGAYVGRILAAGLLDVLNLLGRRHILDPQEIGFYVTELAQTLSTHHSKGC